MYILTVTEAACPAGTDPVKIKYNQLDTFQYQQGCITANSTEQSALLGMFLFTLFYSYIRKARTKLSFKIIRNDQISSYSMAIVIKIHFHLFSLKHG